MSDETNDGKPRGPMAAALKALEARIGDVEAGVLAMRQTANSPESGNAASHAPASPRLTFAEFYAVILPSLLHANPRLADPPVGCAWGPGKGIINAVISQWQSYIHGCALFEQHGADDPEALLLAVDAQGAKIQAGIEAARRRKQAEAAVFHSEPVGA